MSSSLGFSTMAKVLSSLKKIIKSIRLVFVGRFAVFVLLLTQCSFFAAYPIWYTDNLRWIAVVTLYFPAIFYWGHCLKIGAGLARMFHTWGLFVLVALVPNSSHHVWSMWRRTRQRKLSRPKHFESDYMLHSSSVPPFTKHSKRLGRTRRL